MHGLVEYGMTKHGNRWTENVKKICRAVRATFCNFDKGSRVVVIDQEAIIFG